MRVVHVAETVFGGVGSYLDEIGRYQAQSLGSQNVFFVIPQGGTGMLPSVDGAQIVEFPYRGRTPAGLVAFGLAIARAVGRVDPDIVHLHSTFAGLVGRIVTAVRPHKARLIYCPHGWAFGMEVAASRKTLYAWCERLLARTTDAIIVNSASERMLALRHGIPSGKVQVISNGVAAAPSGSQATFPAPSIHLAFIGRHDRQKGLDILLDELGQPGCAHIHLHVVGRSVACGTSPLIGRALRNVTFHGWLSRCEIAALMKEMDAVVMPSRWEAFGLVAIEAMREGVPVIASDKGGLPEIVRHGVDGLIVEIDSPGALGRVLSGLDRPSLRRLGRSARARFKAEFTAERMNREIASTYAALLAGTRRGQAPFIAGSMRTPAE